jgi:hypothetical protein
MHEPTLFLQQLCAQGIEIRPNGEQLRVRGPAHGLSPDVLARLKREKGALLETLHESVLKHRSRLDKLACGTSNRAIQRMSAIMSRWGCGSIHHWIGHFCIAPYTYTQFCLRTTVFKEPKLSFSNNHQFRTHPNTGCGSDSITSESAPPQRYSDRHLLVNRHAQLGPTFPLHGDAPLAVTVGYQALRLTEVAASQWSDEVLWQQVLAVHQVPFALAQGPLYHFTLFTRNASDQRMERGPQNLWFWFQCPC